MAFIRRALLVLLVLFLLVGLAGAGAAYYFYTLLEADLPDLARLEDYNPPLTTTVYDRHGRLIGEFFEERRSLVPAGGIPEVVVQAFVAGEDDTFFEHSGIDYISIARAAYVNFSAGGKIKQGGSTITQQVAKSLLSSERSYTRKLKDMLLAMRIEERFSKDEILYLYLNQIYFGHGAYGVKEAARTYFGKDLRDVNVSEAALLAGLPKAPSDYSPAVNPAAAENRRRYVLQRMREQGFVDEAGYQAALASPPPLRSDPAYTNFRPAAGFTEEVRRFLYRELGGKRVLRGGLVVQTTLDLELQKAAWLSLQRGLEAYMRRHRGWEGPEGSVTRGRMDDALAELGRRNGLAAPPPGEEMRWPENTPLAAVVLEVDRERARLGFAPGVEQELRVEQAAWAFRRPSWRGEDDRRGLDDLLSVGDVAQFVLRPPPVEVMPPAAPSADEATATTASATPPVSSGPARVPRGPLRWELHQAPRVEGALLSLAVPSGDVVAMVGGYDFARSEFNRVIQARRQPGSAFKPFVYGAAINAGYVPSSPLLDAQVALIDPGSGKLWAPKNYNDRFGGVVSMREALARSLNNAAVRVFLDVGADSVIQYARRLGVRSPMGRHLSLSLGSTEVTLAELVRAYGTFAAGGGLLEPRFIVRVLDRRGRVLLEDVSLDPADEGVPPADPTVQTVSTRGGATGFDAGPAGGAEGGFTLPERGILPDEAFMMTYLLRAPVEFLRGTARKARPLERPLAGKTGTTNEQKDAWFVGFSPEIATGVWVGYDEKRILGDKETGGRAALPIWVDYMNQALAGRPASEFPVPAGIEFRRVETGGQDVYDEWGNLVAEGTPYRVSFEPFLTRKIPNRSRQSRGYYFEEEPLWDDEAPTTDSYDLLRQEAF